MQLSVLMSTAAALMSSSRSSCRLLYMVRISLPSAKSSRRAMGQVTGKKANMSGTTSGREAAPIRSPCP